MPARRRRHRSQIGLIQSLTGLSPTGRYNTLIPLVIVISVNALRELYEDVKRHRLDHADNTRAARVLRAGESAVQSVTWATVQVRAQCPRTRLLRIRCASPRAGREYAHLLIVARSLALARARAAVRSAGRSQVGDIVVVSEGEEFPADLLLLAAESAPGVSAHDCFVETANLDGESTFKIRQVARLHAPDEGKRAAGARAARLTGMEVASQQLELDQLGTARVRADFEPPCNQLYTLVGRLAPCDEGGAFTAVPAAFSMQSMLLRGMTLRNTHAVYGLVLYTGADLRSVRNSVATPSKRSSVEKQIDKAVLIIFVCLLVLCVVAWTLAHVESELDGDRAWYVPVDGGESGPSAEWTLLVTDLILFNNLVPISLYVTVEVIKLAMSREIEADARMGELPSGKRASSRTSNLHEDLGQVQYVFTGGRTTDKQTDRRSERASKRASERASDTVRGGAPPVLSCSPSRLLSLSLSLSPSLSLSLSLGCHPLFSSHADPPPVPRRALPPSLPPLASQTRRARSQ
jgi:phospholipid-transporting ATPase